MNRVFFFAFAFLALASCTKVTQVAEQDQAITFQVVNHVHATKANSALATTVRFGTFGYWTPTDWATEGDSNLLFNNLPVKYFGGQNPYWGFETTQYWTKTGKISFASYAPYTTGNSSSVDGFTALPTYSKADGFTFTNYTIVDAANVDLMYADDANNKDCSKEKNADGQMVLSENSTNNFTGVPTLFVHALSQLNFKFQQKVIVNPEVLDSYITVTAVNLKNLYNRNTFTDKTWNLANASASKDNVSYPIYSGSTVINKETQDNPTVLGTPKIVMPQNLTVTADNVTTTGPQILEITYTITTTYRTNPNNPQTTVPITTPVYFGNGSLSQWGQGQDITYVVTISPFEDVPITFDPAVAEWQSTSGTLTVN